MDGGGGRTEKKKTKITDIARKSFQKENGFGERKVKSVRCRCRNRYVKMHKVQRRGCANEPLKLFSDQKCFAHASETCQERNAVETSSNWTDN